MITTKHAALLPPLFRTHLKQSRFQRCQISRQNIPLKQGLDRQYSSSSIALSLLPSCSRSNSCNSNSPRHGSCYQNVVYSSPLNTFIVNHRGLLPNNEGSQARTMVMVTQTTSSEIPDNDNNLETKNNPDSSVENEALRSSGITITSSCASRIRQLASSRANPDAVYLRLYVDAGGCSGFQYKFELLSEDNNGSTKSSANEDDEEEDGTIDPEEDIIFEKDGVRVVVDQTSLELLRGSTIDYVQEMIRSSFAVVNNPQSESACGCGSSFAVKNFEANPALD